jgi:hypothetical protein
LIGELSARLERLQSATPAPVSELADLRCRVETSPATWLAAEVASALALADRLCWDSLSVGDRPSRAQARHAGHRAGG